MAGFFVYAFGVRDVYLLVSSFNRVNDLRPVLSNPYLASLVDLTYA
jgi:hypothetical protein